MPFQDQGFLDRFGGSTGFLGGNAGIFGQQPFANPFSAPQSPLAPGFGGTLGTGSYLGTQAAFSPSSSPFAAGIPPNLAGAPVPVPTPSGYVMMTLVPNGYGGFTYIPLGPPSGGFPGAGGAGVPAGGGGLTYPGGARGSNLLGLSFGGGGNDIFGGFGGGGAPVPTLGGGAFQPRTPFGPSGIQPGTTGFNRSQNTFAGRDLGTQTGPGTFAQSGGVLPIGAGTGPFRDTRPSSGILGGAALQGGTNPPVDPVAFLNSSSGAFVPPFTPPLSRPIPGAPAPGAGGPSQDPRLVNFPDSATGGVQFYFGPDGRPVYTNPGSIGLPSGPGQGAVPGTQPGSTGFAFPSAFGAGGSYYSTPPLGGGLPLGPTAQTLLGFDGGAPGFAPVGPGLSGVPPNEIGVPLTRAPGSLAGSPGAQGGFQGGPFAGPNGGLPAPGSPSGAPGFPGAPSTAGPFSTNDPLGLGANLLVNEIMRREGLLNTAQDQYQNALRTITGSPLAGGVNALLGDLIANPFPFSSDANKDRLIGQASRRIGQATEAARTTVRGASAEAGLRGGETAGLAAGAQFRGSSALSDAITDIEQQIAQARTQERGAASNILGAAGQTLSQSVFGPQLEAASFFERRSNPEIQGLIQLLGQDMALKVAQAVAAQAAGPGFQNLGGVPGFIPGQGNLAPLVLNNLL